MLQKIYWMVECPLPFEHSCQKRMRISAPLPACIPFSQQHADAQPHYIGRPGSSSQLCSRVRIIEPLFQKGASTTVLRSTVKQLYFQLFSNKLLHFTIKNKIADTTARKNDPIPGGIYLHLFSEDCAFSDYFLNEYQASALRFRNSWLR